MSRTGVFICWCGENIARTVDVKRVAEEASHMRGVVLATDYRYMCSDPGQTMLKQAIRDNALTGVVVASCSPRMHETTFRRAAEEAGLNPYLCEMANIREQCSWVHEDREEATAKAIDLVRMMVEKVRRNTPLQTIKVPITGRALVIGGGIAGIQAALDIAAGGREVVLVEKSPSIGGHMAQLSETFPTLDCSQCILTPRMVEAAQHPLIKLYTWSEVEGLEGHIGAFKARIRRKARLVDENACTGCGLCQEKCPRKTPSEFDAGLSQRKAIYIPFPQAVPNKPVIDRELCLKMTDGKCGICQKVCTAGAVDYEQQDSIIVEEVGAVVAATGFELVPRSDFGEYGYGKYPDVIDGLQFERLASASGPTSGEIRRPSDGKPVESIVFIQCVGSRDPAGGREYCSKICCMYTAKHTMLFKHKSHNGRAYVFYMDVRAAGKGYDEFQRRAVEEEGAVYLRGRVSRIYQRDGRMIVMGTDTLSGLPVEIEADMVVLATAVRSADGAEELARILGAGYDRYGFLSEAHPKLRPVESSTAGIFLAGACRGAADIPESVAQAGAAAGKVLGLLSSAELEREGTVAVINETICTGCGTCIAACPYKAIEEVELKGPGGTMRKVARVRESVCAGCGTCCAACPSGSPELKGFSDGQIYAQIDALQVMEVQDGGR